MRSLGAKSVAVENERPLVSVIMNCYNGEKYLREAINSVYGQTYSVKYHTGMVKTCHYTPTYPKLKEY